ncbi:flavin reductase family protein [Streptomyces spectabilis]|uniref:Flavin reductase (DIM6/NTAB) family NADH-FMN oxidoreductase RutF n=2 Tax=Streptomyces spectabilis TaxID=68270 RepID=A0A7W8ANJ2_STRST|nr:flavin reductase family protein [Streptomyces spectabilis]MBB5101091.1 flavin reductase (DIM6/NTAB) family NADH-FMN oxidoreductase RutF [Streptomyces spectabilis]GGV09311.1 oxidoreductase [Streptomyces spectabilis]
MMTEQDFRDLMAGVCAPVTVVTAAEGGTPHGSTVSAFASLSLRPPMVSVALDRASGLLARIQTTGRFGVNVLGAEQKALALRFAGRSANRFDSVRWEYDHDLPRLPDAPGWLVCELTSAVAGGDHRLLLGTVVHARTATAAPLVYGHRTFGTHSAFAPVA